MASAAIKRRSTVDMTEGNLFVKLILFALPIMATTIMQLLYTTIDLTTVHYGASEESMGAIASNNALINLIVVVFTNVSLGVNVILSEARGAGNKDKARKILHTALIFAFFSGLFVGTLGFFISDNLLEMMRTEAHYMEKATLYLRIYFCGLPFLMIYNYCAQILRAQGDSRTPFFILAIAGATNVAFDCLFVFPLHMDVAGVATATVISEGLSAVLGIIALAKGKRGYVHLHFKQLRIDKVSLIEMLRVGLPAGLQGFFFSLPNVFIQSSLYTIEPGNVNLENGAIASANIEGYFFAVVDAIGAATMTFIAANLGAKRTDNIKKCALYGLAWGGMFCVLVALATGLLYRPLLHLFVDKEEAIMAGRDRLFVMGFFYLLNLLMNLSAATLRGLKKSVFPMITTMVFCTGLRILLILTVFPLPTFHTVTWLYSLFPITWGLAFVCNGIALGILMPRILRRVDAEKAALETEKAEEAAEVPAE